MSSSYILPVERSRASASGCIQVYALVWRKMVLLVLNNIQSCRLYQMQNNFLYPGASIDLIASDEESLTLLAVIGHNLLKLHTDA